MQHSPEGHNYKQLLELACHQTLPVNLENMSFGDCLLDKYEVDIKTFLLF